MNVLFLQASSPDPWLVVTQPSVTRDSSGQLWDLGSDQTASTLRRLDQGQDQVHPAHQTFKRFKKYLKAVYLRPKTSNK